MINERKKKLKNKKIRKFLSFWPILWLVFPDLRGDYWHVLLLFACYAIFSFIISSYSNNSKTWRLISNFCFVINIIAALIPIVFLIVFIILVATGNFSIPII